MAFFENKIIRRVKEKGRMSGKNELSLNQATKKINLLNVINGLGIGVAERNLVELVKYLDKDKYNIRICSVGQGGQLKKDFEDLGVKVVVFPKKTKFDFSLIFKVAKLIKQENIDIVQTVLFYADIIGVLAAKLAKAPVIISWSAGSTPKGSKNSK